MSTPSYEVDLLFQEDESGVPEYTFPYLQELDDEQEGMKATVIKGKRGDGSIVIPGGKESQVITATGYLIANGYEDLTSLMATMRQNVTTNIGILTLKHREGAGAWSTDWSYTVRRISPINFAQSMRLDIQEYSVKFLVLSY